MNDNRTSQRPYLCRALHEWMTDNDHTPHIVVDANYAGTQVPTEFVQDGRIVLNVSYAATRDLVLGNELITFQARFGGRHCQVSIPVMAVQAIYARETGEGMMFTDATHEPDETPDDEHPADGNDPDRPHLRVIK